MEILLHFLETMEHFKCFKSVYLQGTSCEFDCSSSVDHSLVQPLSLSWADPYLNPQL